MSKDDAMKKYMKNVLEITKKIPGKESEALRKELEGYVHLMTCDLTHF
jgi:hypothetical protein